MTKIFLSLLLACGGLRQSAPTVRSDLIAVIATLHSLDWNDVNADTVRAQIPWKLTRETVSVTEPCDEEHWSGEKLDQHIWIRLSPFLKDGRCHHSLSSISYWIDFNSIEGAEAFRAHAIGTLRAGGVPDLHDRQMDFRWRHRDSSRYFNLYTNIQPKQRHYRVWLRLIHTQASPSEIDTLPFEAGYVPRD